LIFLDSGNISAYTMRLDRERTMPDNKFFVVKSKYPTKNIGFQKAAKYHVFETNDPGNALDFAKIADSGADEFEYKEISSSSYNDYLVATKILEDQKNMKDATDYSAFFLFSSLF